MTTEQKEFLYLNNKKLMDSIIRYYANKFLIDSDELLSASYDIFLDCIDNYDPSHPSKASFTTYLKNGMYLRLKQICRKIKKSYGQTQLYFELEENLKNTLHYQSKTELIDFLEIAKKKLNNRGFSIIESIISGKIGIPKKEKAGASPYRKKIIDVCKLTPDIFNVEVKKIKTWWAKNYQEFQFIFQ